MRLSHGVSKIRIQTSNHRHPSDHAPQSTGRLRLGALHGCAGASRRCGPGPAGAHGVHGGRRGPSELGRPGRGRRGAGGCGGAGLGVHSLGGWTGHGESEGGGWNLSRLALAKEAIHLKVMKRALLLGRLGGCVLQRLQFLLFVKKLGIEVKDLSLTSTE